jgi:hypothetical protein
MIRFDSNRAHGEKCKGRLCYFIQEAKVGFAAFHEKRRKPHDCDRSQFGIRKNAFCMISRSRMKKILLNTQKWGVAIVSEFEFDKITVMDF